MEDGIVHSDRETATVTVGGTDAIVVVTVRDRGPGSLTWTVAYSRGP